MYLIADMGAGTTEFSVNQVTEGGDDQKLNCYFDESIRIGGDDLLNVGGQAGLERISKVLQRFRLSFARTWKHGSDKDCLPAARTKWRKLRVVLTGGGARHVSIRELIENKRPDPCFGVATESYAISWHSPRFLDWSSFPAGHPESDLPLLSVAHGLSVERQWWPVFHNPNDIKKQSPMIEYTSPAAHLHFEK
jgi:hypothetical protein